MVVTPSTTSPLHRCNASLETAGKKRAAQLLLYTVCYLYHKAGIFYYRDDGTYHYWNYKMVSDWVRDHPEGWETDNYSGYVGEINTAACIGDTMHRRIWNTKNLERFGQAVIDFEPRDILQPSALPLPKQSTRCGRITQRLTCTDMPTKAACPTPMKRTMITTA